MVLQAPIKGFLDGALLICFLLMIGGSFAIFQETGAVDFGIRRLTAGGGGQTWGLEKGDAMKMVSAPKIRGESILRAPPWPA
jgi:hypothetical protein